MTVSIPLGGARAQRESLVVLVDPDDAELVRRHSWSLDTSGYPHATIGGRRVLMHRHILGLQPGDGVIADHINRDRLDNRRENLRCLLSRAHSAQNRSSYAGSKSAFRGVSWDSREGKWRASCRLNGKAHFLGCFVSEEEAARVASDFRREHMPYSEDALT